GLAAGMATPDHDDVEPAIHRASFTGRTAGGQNTAMRPDLAGPLVPGRRPLDYEAGGGYVAPESICVSRETPLDGLAIIPSAIHLPTQKSRKITSRMSSTSTRPVSPPSAPA